MQRKGLQRLVKNGRRTACLMSRGIKNKRVLDAMMKVPRHLFVPDDLKNQSYEDYPLSIGYGQTISQPYIVAFMTEQLDPQPHHHVLELAHRLGLSGGCSFFARFRSLFH
jgi:protein-L-isoaspartate O-methyltransferase